MNIFEVNAESCYAGIKNPINDDSEFNPMFTDEEIRQINRVEDARLEAEAAMGRLKKINPDFCDDCGKPYSECMCFSPCCSAPIIHSDICSGCGEHCI